MPLWNSFESSASWLFPPFFNKAHAHLLDTLKKDLEAAVNRKLKKPYESANALFLSWEETDLKIQGEINDLQIVLRNKYGFEVETWSIPNITSPDDPNGSTNALEETLIHFRGKHNSPTDLILIYYGGHGDSDSRGGSVWHSHGDKDAPSYAEVKWFDLQQTLARAQSDVLFVLDCCFAMATAREPRQIKQGTKEYLVASGRNTKAIAGGDFTFTKQLAAALVRLSYDGKPVSILKLHAELSLERQLTISPIHVILTEPYEPIILVPTISGTGTENPRVARPTRVLISVSLYTAETPDIGQWIRWLTSNYPEGVNKISVEGIYDSNSSLMVLSLPICVWEALSANPAYSFIGFVHSKNLISKIIVDEDIAATPITRGKTALLRTGSMQPLRDISHSFHKFTEDQMIRFLVDNCPTLNIEKFEDIAEELRALKDGGIYSSQPFKGFSNFALQIVLASAIRRNCPEIASIILHASMDRNAYWAMLAYAVEGIRVRDSSMQEEGMLDWNFSSGPMASLQCLLEYSAKFGHSQIVKLSLDLGAIASPRAMNAAAGSGWLSIVTMLLNAKASVKAKIASSEVEPALHVAARAGHLHVVQELLAHGADVDAKYSGHTALGLAAGSGHLDVVQTLIKFGADVNGNTNFTSADPQTSPISIAASSRRLEIVKFLVGHGANLRGALTGAVTGAVGRDDFEVLNYILSLLKDSSARSAEIKEALEKSVQSLNALATTNLLDVAIDVDTTLLLEIANRHTRTDSRASYDKVQIVKILNADANPNDPFRIFLGRRGGN